MVVKVISCLQDNYSYLIIDKINNWEDLDNLKKREILNAVSYTHLTLPTNREV